MINVVSGYDFPGLSAARMLQSSVQGCIHSVSREVVPARHCTKS
jgi:hypothetical protein